MTPEIWIDVVVTLVVAVFGAIGAFLFFVLRGIRDNQKDIWNWAREEVSKINTSVFQTSISTQEGLTDVRRWVRHEFRHMYGELIELARIAGKVENKEIAEETKDLIGSITKRLDEGDL